MRLAQTGYRIVDDETLAAYLQGERLDELVPNEYVIHNDKALRFDGAKLVKLHIHNFKDKFKPMNELQACAFDLMDNFDVPIKVLCGLAGSGKTKIGIKFASEHLIKGKVDRLVIVRNNESIGNDLGAFKGDKDEKVSNWMLPIRDIAPELFYDMMADKRMYDVEFTVPALLMGRDFQRTALVVDDAQLLTREQVKMCGERVGQGGYVVFLGDYNQAYKDKFKKNNGLVSMIEQFYGHSLFGMVELRESVRSEVAELFATMEV
jgi:predicted ribonuclease YlaK